MLTFRRWVRPALLPITAAYTLVLGAIAYTIAYTTDAWWIGTVLAFAPKWPWAVPWPFLLLPWLLSWRSLSRRSAAVGGTALLAGALLWLAPIAGLRWGGAGAKGTVLLRLATYNIGGLPPSAAVNIAEWLEREKVDVAFLQECSLDFGEPQWRDWHTQKAFSQCFVSRHPPLTIDVRDPKNFWDKGGSGLMTKYVQQTSAGPVVLMNVHLETPREGFEALREKRLGGVKDLDAVNAARRREAAEVRRFLGDLPDKLVIAGDFNMLQSSTIFRRHFGDLIDAFDRVGMGFGDTKVTRWHRVRIDHVLVGGQLDVASLKLAGSLGGDHRPLVVEVSSSM